MTDGGADAHCASYVMCVLRYVRSLRSKAKARETRPTTNNVDFLVLLYMLATYRQAHNKQRARVCASVCVQMYEWVCVCFVLYSSVVLKPSRENLFA